MKNMALFVCSKCDGQFSKWSGQCSECGAWGTVHASEDEPKTPKGRLAKSGTIGVFSKLQQGASSPIATGLTWLDAVLSGGLVPGSVTLLGGEPGIGKSTITAQLAVLLAKAGKKVLYITGEESPTQVSSRLRRVSGAELPDTLLFLDETEASTIAATLLTQKPDLTIIDSIQTVRYAELPGEPGNPTQIKASSAVISEAAKDAGLSVLLIGQVNKDGDLAGPRLLEHLVDTVMMIEGDRGQSHRLLRVLKHRFGTADESVFLEMTETGMKLIEDPSALLLAERPKNAPGTIVAPVIQGNTAILVELQVLVTPAGYGTPLRRTSGIEQNRASLLLAVLARRVGAAFGDQDVFANIVGGFSLQDQGLDLPFCLAAISAKSDQVIATDVAAFGEVGLAGELRPVTRIDARIKELERMGFSTIIIPKSSKTPKATKARLIQCTTVREAAEQLGLFKVR